MRRSTPIAVGVTALLLALAWQYLTVRFNYGMNWTALFHTGESTALPPSPSDQSIYRFPGSNGYEGMFYRLIAHDPLFTRGYAAYVDNPRVRWRRILVPGMANIFSAGRDSLIDYSCIAVTLLFVLLGGFWLSRYCVLNGLHPGWGMAFLLIPSVLISIDRQTVDTAAAALLVGFMLYCARAPYKAYALLAFLPLARETGLCITAGAMILEWRRRHWERLILAAISIVPFVAWAGYVSLHTSRDRTPWLSLPFMGLLTRTLNPVQYPLTGPWVKLAAVLDYTAVLGIWLALAFVVYVVLRRPVGMLGTCLAVFSLAIVFLAQADIWEGAYEFGRSTSPLLIMLMMFAISTKEYRYLLPMIFVLPRILLQYQPQVSGIVSGIFGQGL
jgi:hypothetical protein